MVWHYDVQKGDCLSVIAQNNGETLAQLEANNPQFSANWDLIYAGQKVTIGGKSNPPAGGPLQPSSVTVSIDEHPLRNVSGLMTQRVDMGQDFGGSGPIYAVGRGEIVNVWGAGWPGGVYILEKITDGPGKGQYIYFAENITPNVVVGQHVDYTTVIGHMNGGIEIGWGTSTPEQTLAAATTGYTEGVPTTAGLNMQQFLLSLIHVEQHTAAHHIPQHHAAPVAIHGSTVAGVKNAGTIFNFLVAHGFSHNAAAGILGNIGQESHGDPWSVGSGGCGLIGWTPCSVPVGNLWAQMDDVVKYAETYGSIPDINAHSASPTEAADWFMSNYERCNPLYCDSGNRESIAMAIASAG